MNVLHMRHRLAAPPTCTVREGIAIRTFTPNDVAAWLALRAGAFAAETPPVRAWIEADFAREMTAKPWWRDEHTWLATPDGTPTDLVGAVTLAMRNDATVVHWLMVDPAWRRRGIASLLIGRLEESVWNCGMREVHLESHKNWHAAVQLYSQLGYRNSSFES